MKSDWGRGMLVGSNIDWMGAESQAKKVNQTGTDRLIG